MLGRLAGRGERRQGAPVEAAEALTTTWRPRPPNLRASLSAALVGLGARVGEEHLPGCAGDLAEQAGRPSIAAASATGLAKRLTDVQQRRGPASAMRVGDHRVGVAERRRRRGRRGSRGSACRRCPTARCPCRARTSTGGGPNTGMNGQWSRSGDRRTRASVMVSRRQTIVPMPASVKISSSSTWATRPSRMWARAHAVAHGVDAARRPWGSCRRSIVPSAISASSSSARRLADQARRVVDVAAQALDVGEVDELLGAQRLGDGAGDGVGVDVVGLPAASVPMVAIDRDELLGQQAARGCAG